MYFVAFADGESRNGLLNPSVDWGMLSKPVVSKKFLKKSMIWTFMNGRVLKNNLSFATFLVVFEAGGGGFDQLILL